MVIARIHNFYKTLTVAEKKIASYIMEYPEKVVSMTIKGLAEACNTAPSAVNRMCSSIGIEGFARLKIDLAVDIAKAHSGIEKVKNGDQYIPENIFKNVFSSGIDTLRTTLEMLDFSSVEDICKMLSKAKRIIIFGVGTSSVIATDAAYRFSQLGLQAYSYSDILHMNVMAMNMQEGDVVLGISHSGDTKAVVDAVRYAKKAGAAVIALSSFAGSILCREADCAVTVFADEENYPIEAVSARIAHMCVIDALMMTLAAMKYEDFDEHIAMRNKALEEMRY